MIFCDIDGVLAKSNPLAHNCMGSTHTKEQILKIMDPVVIAKLEPNMKMVEELRKHYQEKEFIAIITGRWSYLENITKAWLDRHGIWCHAVACRGPDKWQEPSVDIKKQLIESFLDHKKNPIFHLMKSAGAFQKTIYYDDDLEALEMANTKFGFEGRHVEC